MDTPLSIRKATMRELIVARSVAGAGVIAMNTDQEQCSAEVYFFDNNTGQCSSRIKRCSAGIEFDARDFVWRSAKAWLNRAAYRASSVAGHLIPDDTSPQVDHVNDQHERELEQSLLRVGLEAPELLVHIREVSRWPGLVSACERAQYYSSMVQTELLAE